MKPSRSISDKKWLDLSEAADLLGVHFTTLRRWADLGQVPFIRTPGGRRRFSHNDLEQFLQSLSHSPYAIQPVEQQTIELTRQHVRSLPPQSTRWMAAITDEQRQVFRRTGQRLIALMIQYGSRAEGGEPFLEEGQALTRQYGCFCRQDGMTLAECVSAFLAIRHSILASILETSRISTGDPESLNIYHRSNEFLDALLLSTIESYSTAS